MYEDDKLALMAAMILPGMCTLYGKTQMDATVLASLSVAHAQRILNEIKKNKEKTNLTSEGN